MALSQIRDLEVLLTHACDSTCMFANGKQLDWESLTSRHLSPNTLGGWAGLASTFVPPNTTYAECVHEAALRPEFYVIIPWDMKLCDAFKAIEQHAAALGLSDRATYFIPAWSQMPTVVDGRDPRWKDPASMMQFTWLFL